MLKNKYNKLTFLFFLLTLPVIVFSQRVIPVAKRKFPITPNQIIKEDNQSDEYGEYKERNFQGQEEDTALLNEDFRKREEYKKGKITNPEKPDGYDLEKFYYMNEQDFQKNLQEEKRKNGK